MPARQQHLAKAETNQALSLSLQANQHLDWSATVLFYAALHLVEAALAPTTHSRNHSERDRNIQRDPRLQPIYLHYRELYARSLEARYDCVTFSLRQVQLLYVGEYEPIKRHLRPLLEFIF